VDLLDLGVGSDERVKRRIEPLDNAWRLYNHRRGKEQFPLP
jgi:hypothetical protein